MNPTSILLLPAPEHREALLGDSPGGGRVPTACLYRSLDDGSLRWGLTGIMLDTPALVLRWRGEDDPMGCDRLRYVVADVAGSDHRDHVAADLAQNSTIELATVATINGVGCLGRVIYLDADGREVSP